MQPRFTPLCPGTADTESHLFLPKGQRSTSTLDRTAWHGHGPRSLHPKGLSPQARAAPFPLSRAQRLGQRRGFLGDGFIRSTADRLSCGRALKISEDCESGDLRLRLPWLGMLFQGCHPRWGLNHRLGGRLCYRLILGWICACCRCPGWRRSLQATTGCPNRPLPRWSWDLQPRLPGPSKTHRDIKSCQRVSSREQNVPKTAALEAIPTPHHQTCFRTPAAWPVPTELSGGRLGHRGHFVPCSPLKLSCHV